MSTPDTATVAECVVEVGHVSVSRTAKWRDALTGMTVCDRHRSQYDESEFGPFEWEPVEPTCAGSQEERSTSGRVPKPSERAISHVR